MYSFTGIELIIATAGVIVLLVLSFRAGKKKQKTICAKIIAEDMLELEKAENKLDAAQLFADALFEKSLMDLYYAPARYIPNPKAPDHIMQWGSSVTAQDVLSAEASMHRDLKAAKSRKDQITIIRKRVPKIIEDIVEIIWYGEIGGDEKTVRAFRELANHYGVPSRERLQKLRDSSSLFYENKQAWQRDHPFTQPFPVEEP